MTKHLISEKKLFKQGEFMAAADHLIFAVGGNMSKYYFHENICITNMSKYISTEIFGNMSKYISMKIFALKIVLHLNVYIWP